MDLMSIVPFIIAFFLVLISYLLFRDEENKGNQQIEDEMQEWVEKEVPAQKNMKSTRRPTLNREPDNLSSSEASKNHEQFVNKL